MSPVTGLTRLSGQLCCLFIWKISARSSNKTKIVEHVSFATVAALDCCVALLIRLIC